MSLDDNEDDYDSDSGIKLEGVSLKSVGAFQIASYSKMQKDFARLYAECFAGPPYFEKYEESWIVENVYDRFIDSGCIMVVLQDAKPVGLSRAQLVGFSCAQRVERIKDTSVYRYLASRKSLPFELEKSCYVAELAVLPAFRKKGIGTSLLSLVYVWGNLHGMSSYVSRTAYEGSNSLGIFLRLGAKMLPDFQTVDGDEGEVPSASSRRVYVWGDLRSCRGHRSFPRSS